MVDRDIEQNRESVGRKGGMSGEGSTMQRQGAGENVKQGWQQFREKVRGKWNDISDRDLDQYQNKNRNDLVGYLNQKTGQDRNSIERDVDTFARDTNYRWE